jgi:type I restriction enzyme M protein
MMRKMKPVTEGGSRLAIVFNGSPLFTGAAGSGESEIRRHLLENDLLEAIVALPDQMFYNTGINTYIWVVTNRKPKPRRGKVQLINGVSFFRKMRKSLGDKRKELGEQDIATIVRLFNAFEEGPHVKTFDNEDFGFQRITVERPLKLDFQAHPDRLARLEDEKPWQALLTSKKKGAAAAKEIEEGQALQEAVRRVLARFDPERVYLSRSAFTRTSGPTPRQNASRFRRRSPRPSSAPSRSATRTPKSAVTNRETPSPTPISATTRTSPSRTTSTPT